MGYAASAPICPLLKSKILSYLSFKFILFINSFGNYVQFLLNIRQRLCRNSLEQPLQYVDRHPFTSLILLVDCVQQQVFCNKSHDWFALFVNRQ